MHAVASSISQKVGLLRKCIRIYSDVEVIRNCFFSFILPHFEYCSPVWLSASEVHLRLLDRAFNQIKFLLPSLNINLRHRRLVGALSYLFKICTVDGHPLSQFLPDSHQPTRATRRAANLNDRAFLLARCRTTQFSRCFFPSMTGLWNELPNDVVLTDRVETFKMRVNSFLLS